MNIEHLIPPPTHWEAFRRDRHRFIPPNLGCYALTTFDRVVLYIGLSNNLRSRFDQHLDSPRKIGLTQRGKAVLFHWLETDDVQTVERTWLNIHYEHEGCRPILNAVDSPVSV